MTLRITWFIFTWKPATKRVNFLTYDVGSFKLKATLLPIKILRQLTMSNFEWGTSFSLRLINIESRPAREFWRKWKKYISCSHQAYYLWKKHQTNPDFNVKNRSTDERPGGRYIRKNWHIPRYCVSRWDIEVAKDRRSPGYTTWLNSLDFGCFLRYEKAIHMIGAVLFHNSTQTQL